MFALNREEVNSFFRFRASYFYRFFLDGKSALNKLLENPSETGGGVMSQSAAESILRAIQPGGGEQVETEIVAPGGITGVEMNVQAEPGLEEMIGGSPEGEAEAPETAEMQSPELDEMIVGEAPEAEEEQA